MIKPESTKKMQRKRAVKGVSRGSDPTFAWVERFHQQHLDVLRPWVDAARRWLVHRGKTSPAVL